MATVLRRVGWLVIGHLAVSPSIALFWLTRHTVAGMDHSHYA